MDGAFGGSVGEAGEEAVAGFDLGGGAENRAGFFHGGDGIAAAEDFGGCQGAELGG